MCCFHRVLFHNFNPPRFFWASQKQGEARKGDFVLHVSFWKATWRVFTKGESTRKKNVVKTTKTFDLKSVSSPVPEFLQITFWNQVSDLGDISTVEGGWFWVQLLFHNYGHVSQCWWGKTVSILSQMFLTMFKIEKSTSLLKLMMMFHVAACCYFLDERVGKVRKTSSERSASALMVVYWWRVWLQNNLFIRHKQTNFIAVNQP